MCFVEHVCHLSTPPCSLYAAEEAVPDCVVGQNTRPSICWMSEILHRRATADYETNQYCLSSNTHRIICVWHAHAAVDFEHGAPRHIPNESKGRAKRSINNVSLRQTRKWAPKRRERGGRRGRGRGRRKRSQGMARVRPSMKSRRRRER